MLLQNSLLRGMLITIGFSGNLYGQHSMSDDSPIRIKTLLEQCGGNIEIGEVVLDEFLLQIVTDIQEIETCLANGDLLQAGRVGHRLKGTAGVLGADKMRSICLSLETAGKSENAEETGKTFLELKAEADRCVAAVPEARIQLQST